MPRIDVLLNDSAGSTTSESRARIEAAFASTGADARVIAVPGRELAAAAERAARDGRILVAAGGDGTVSTVAGVAAAAGATFGVIPLGTLNHFAKDAGIPLDVDAAARVIADGVASPIDVADANGRVFVNNASAGFYARMVREREVEQRRGHAKWTAFALALRRTWRDYRAITVRLTVDGATRVMRTPFVFIGNGEYVAEGVHVGQRASISTGSLSVYTAPDSTRGEMLVMMARAIAGRLTPDVPLEKMTAREVTIEPRSAQLPLAADGELLHVAGPVQFTVRPGGLCLLRPAQARG
jgi:diacylglycerol kinase family enzyme